MKRHILTKKDIFIVLACAAFLLLTLGSIGRSGREQARRTICANNLKQLGTLLDLYCADYQGYYPPAYSIWYMNGASSYTWYDGPALGLLGILPYLVDQDGPVHPSNPQNYYGSLKSRDNVRYLKFFWCPSGVVQYHALGWQGTAFASFGYNQYCQQGGSHHMATCKIGDQVGHMWQYLEHCPLKNTPHINGGFMDKNGNWIPYKSNGGWVTFTDIAFAGYPYTPQWPRSNHHKMIRSTSGTSAGRSKHGCAGSNSLHVDGRVNWNSEKVMNDNDKLVHIWINPDAIGVYGTSYWIFPRTP